MPDHLLCVTWDLRYLDIWFIIVRYYLSTEDIYNLVISCPDFYYAICGVNAFYVLHQVYGYVMVNSHVCELCFHRSISVTEHFNHLCAVSPRRFRNYFLAFVPLSPTYSWWLRRMALGRYQAFDEDILEICFMNKEEEEFEGGYICILCIQSIATLAEYYHHVDTMHSERLHSIILLII